MNWTEEEKNNYEQVESEFLDLLYNSNKIPEKDLQERETFLRKYLEIGRVLKNFISKFSGKTDNHTALKILERATDYEIRARDLSFNLV